MPEGHVIHRLARDLTGAFGGRAVRVSSPQGRFAEAAGLLDGTVLLGAEAWGKHLFVDFGGRFVHIHLGLIGKLRLAEGLELAAPDTLRLRISEGAWVAELRGPQTCALITDAERAAVVATLGADPLRADALPERAWQRISRSSRAVASLLMDQRVTAGVGNIFRCEVLLRHNIPPMLPGNELSRVKWNRVWADLVELMGEAVVKGRIDTVWPQHLPEAMGRPPRVDRHGGEVYVYRRTGQPCLRCSRAVSEVHFEGRRLYWCGTCQRRR